MLKKSLISIVIVVLLLSMLACTAHVHRVGSGARTGQVTQQRQWYILWGLIPLNDVDTGQMAAGATDYEITTEYSFIDIVISYFTSMVTVNCRTVTVKK